jgi:hypothetical protein
MLKLLVGLFTAGLFLSLPARADDADDRANQLIKEAASFPAHLSGNNSSDWQHTWVTIKGQRFMAIEKVSLNDDLSVRLTNPMGDKVVAVSDLPQAFLDQWGLTTSVLQGKWRAKAASLAQEANAFAKEEEDAALKLSSVKMYVRVLQVLDERSILGNYNNGAKIIRITDIDASNLAQDNFYSGRVWRSGVFRYVTTSGAGAQIENYTASPDVALAGMEKTTP